LLKLIALDVGHGNCAVIQCDAVCVVIDAGFSATLYESLALLGVTEINALFLSHADADHIGAVASLLAGPMLIRHLYVNPDGKKQTKAWRTLRSALRKMRKDGSGIKTHSSLNAADPGEVDFGGFVIDVLAPNEDVMLGGGAGSRHDDRTLSVNDCSVVLRVRSDGRSVALFTGDATEWTWGQVEQEVPNAADRQAQILIAPHHGGEFGSRSVFERLLEDVRPRYAVISNGRTKNGNPQPPVVDALRSRNIRVICTQLGETCGSKGNGGLGAFPARGSTSYISCGGSIAFDVPAGVAAATDDVTHEQFVDLISASALCRRTVVVTKS